MPCHRFAAAVALLFGLGLAGAACSDSILPNAFFMNTVDTVTLAAVDGTPVTEPSGYDMTPSPVPQVVHTHLSTSFDFVFNIDTLGRALLISANALGLGGQNGLLPVTQTFEQLRFAPAAGYNIDSAEVITPGRVLAVRTRLFSCELGAIFFYGKLRVVSIDMTARTVTFEVLSNLNCGYRSLEPGRPTE